MRTLLPRPRRARILGIGIDLLEVARMERELERDRPAFARQIFLPGERAACEAKRYPARHYAARFAAKEAVFKALALEETGMGAWREVEIRTRGAGAGRVVLHGALKRLAAGRGVRRVWLSMTHDRRLAAAGVVLES